ncbi:hypothetical protein Ahy_A07g036517 [Arachis hypogaea]|uniref:Uncharacterized protein n=1 Tax=Arachis hypogaea TaxID=3818 RepID=A0A445CGE5_ARAHY|nr:hypothetical protein Ahy_A07g036517 [Arachis hypogaea]
MIEDVRERRDYLTIWLRPDLKKALYVLWETNEEFKRLRLMNRANKTSAMSSKYTGGLTTFMKTKARLTRDNGNNSDASEVDPDRIWRKTIAVPYKNRIYGMGLFFTNNLRTSTLRPSSTSATSQHVITENGIDLREQLLELIWSLN